MYKLYVQQKVFKWRDSYQVLDEAGQPVYQVEQDFKFLGNTVHVQHLTKNRSFVIDRELLRLMPRYQVAFNDGSSMYIRQVFTFFIKQIEVESDRYKLELRGRNLWDHDFEVYQEDAKVGQIQKIWLTWGDTYEISVYNPEFEEELLALLIVVDDILDMAQKRNRG